MSDGKGALRKGWQYTCEKWEKPEKSGGFNWGQCRKDNTESKRD